MVFTLDNLRKQLLFNGISDVWIAYCDELGLDWSDFGEFKRFSKFLESKGVSFKSLGVCPTGSGPKEEFIKKVSILLGDPNKTFVIKTDDVTIQKIRQFASEAS